MRKDEVFIIRGNAWQFTQGRRIIPAIGSVNKKVHCDKIIVNLYLCRLLDTPVKR